MRQGRAGRGASPAAEVRLVRPRKWISEPRATRPARSTAVPARWRRRGKDADRAGGRQGCAAGGVQTEGEQHQPEQEGGDLSFTHERFPGCGCR